VVALHSFGEKKFVLETLGYKCDMMKAYHVEMSANLSSSNEPMFSDLWSALPTKAKDIVVFRFIIEYIVA
jgi:hypothetical protein